MSRALVFKDDTIVLRAPEGGSGREYRIGTPDGEGRIILTPVDIPPTPFQIETFKRAWQTANSQGLTGDRVRHGLWAVLNIKEKP